MRLRRLDLDFFGHFAGKSYDFGAAKAGASDFHIVFGANEAGKTTTMEGFLRLLYGFPLREPYAFRHPRANLRVSGVLEIGGATQQFTRLPTRGANLLNAQGDPVPETALQSALSGLTVEDYRKLLCLDDETIEKGGEEIAQSKGDIGRLLFSAAAGVSDLSVVLEEVEQRAGAFYKKGGSKSQFAQLKRELEEVSGEIRSRDVSAGEYRKLRQEVEAAQAREAELRAARLTALQRQSRLEALAAGLPLLQRLTGLDEALAALKDYPATLEIDPEDLVRLLTDRASLMAQATSFEREIAAKSAARAALSRRPDLCAAGVRLEALREQRGRHEAAEIDLPKRRDARAAVRADMRQCLRDIGLAGDLPEQFVVPEADLTALEAGAAALHAAEQAALMAGQEARGAAEKQAQAARDLMTLMAQTEGQLPDLKALLEHQDATRVFEAYSAAQQALRLARRAQDEALARISIGGQAFDTAPQGGLPAAEALALARTLEKARDEVATRGTAQAEASARALVLERQIAVIRSAAGFVTDDLARESRAAREALWQAHLARMDALSAGEFEAAMRLDDGHSAARQAHASDLGALRHLELDAVQAGVALEAAEEGLAHAQAEQARVEAVFSQAVAEAGLARVPSAEAFAAWLAEVERARAAAGAYQRELREAAPVLAAAEDLSAALAQALEGGTLDGGMGALAPLLDRARAAAEAQGHAAQAIDLAKKFEEICAYEAEQRADRAAEALRAEASRRGAWEALIAARFGAEADPQRMRGALADLRRLREFDATRQTIERQIQGMEADQAGFVSALQVLAQDLDEIADLPIADMLKAIETQGAEAREAEARWRALGRECEAAQERLAETEAALLALDARVRHLAESFPRAIAADDLGALREAVREAQRAITLRAEAEDLGRVLCAGLGVQSRAEAEAVLAGQEAEAVQAALAEIARDLAPLDGQVTQAIETRSRAQAALDLVTGGADVAALVARRRTLEAEMETGAMRYLEDRLGHMLADRAIRRYRDTHRHGMMASAETAFRALTSGAYGDLTTQSDGSAEILVAVQASDGAAKPAEAMSKGTRFQLYLALRAAAYAQMVENGTVLPFFCDDVFETFDDMRTRAACQLMHRIGQGGQAIYLTHHQHVVDIARETCGDEVVIHQL